MTRSSNMCQEVGGALLSALVVRTVPESAASPDRIAAALDRLEAAVAMVEEAMRDLRSAQADLRLLRVLQGA